MQNCKNFEEINNNIEDVKSIFPFNKITTHLHDLIATDLTREEIFAVLITFINSLDKLRLESFNFSFSSIQDQPFTDNELAELKKAFLTHRTKITFFECKLPLEFLLDVEADRETVSKASEMSSLLNLANKLELIDSKNVAKAHIQPLEEEKPIVLSVADEIKLPRIVAKPNLQCQFERVLETKQEIHVQQAWQIDAKLEMQQQKQTANREELLSDFGITVITRADIQAALNKENKNHHKAQEKLGHLLCSYNCKGRDLLDLWDRIVGDELWAKLCSFEDPLTIFRYNITAIEKKALLQMALHAHEFQYGLHMSALPNGFNFIVLTTHKELHGLLDYNKDIQHDSILAPQLQLPGKPEKLLPSHRHLVNDLACHDLFEMVKKFNADQQYEAWHLFADFFDVITLFDKEMISWLISQINYETSNEVTQPKSLLVKIKYLLLAFQFNLVKKNPLNVFNSTDYKALNEYLTSHESSRYTLAFKDSHDQERNYYDEIVKLVNNRVVNLSHDQDFFNKLLTLQAATQTIANKIPEDRASAASQVLLKYGIDGLQLLHELFDHLSFKLGKKWFDNFDKIFIKPLINLNELLTPQSLHSFKQLLQLDPAELNWWNSLTAQHFEQSGFAQFSDLMEGFHTFLEELAKLKIRHLLPHECPLTNIAHFKVGLSRLLTILQNALSPEEQLQHLEGLNFSENGAVYASKHLNYFLVTKEMCFTPQDESTLKVKDKSSIYSSFGHEMHHLTCDLAIDQIGYCRRLGMMKYRHPYKVHLELLNIAFHFEIPSKRILTNASMLRDQNGYFDVKNSVATAKQHLALKSQILNLLFKGTTGNRNMTSLPPTSSEREKTVTRFIHSILRISQHANEKIVTRDGDIPISYFYFRHIANYGYFKETSELAKLNLHELTTLFDLIYQCEHPIRNVTTTRPPCIFSDGDYTASKNLLELSAELFKRYPHYMAQAVANFQFNSGSSYIHYCRLVDRISATKFSEKNKGLLIRLLSLVKLINKNDKQNDDFLQLLSNLEKRSIAPGFDIFILIFSSIRPRVHAGTLLSFNELNQLVAANDVEEALHAPEFSHLEIVKHPDDFMDAKFYASEKELEASFSGLGNFYREIKTLLFSIYNAHTQAEWHEFLDILQRIGKHLSETQRPEHVYKSVTTALLKANWVNCSLATITSILSVFAKYLIHYKSFPESLLSAIKVDVFQDKILPVFQDLLATVLALPNVDIPISTKEKLIKIAFRLEIDSFNDLRQLTKVNLNALEIILNFLIDQKGEGKIDSQLDNIAYLISKFEVDAELVLIIKDLFTWLIKIPSFLTAIANDVVNRNQLRIIARTAIPDEAYLKLIIKYLLKLPESELSQLASQYKVAPYPKFSLNLLINNSISVTRFCENAISDPFDHRDKATLEKQFDTASALPHIKNIKIQSITKSENYEIPVLQALTPLHKKQQMGLYHKLDEINQIGETIIRTLSMDEIRQKIRHPKTDELTRIAAAREVLYRTSPPDSPIWPNHLQLLNLLCQEDSLLSSRRLFFKMASGAGKSVTSSLSAVMGWVEDSAVVLLTHQSGFAYRDKQAFKNFYEALNIPVTMLVAGSQLSDFNPKGVHYAEFSAFALFLQAVELETGISIIKSHKIFFILDEGDAPLLHNEMSFNLTFSFNELGKESVHAWLFSFLMDYVKEHVIVAANKQPAHNDNFIIKTQHLINELKRKHPNSSKQIEDPEFQIRLCDWLTQAWQTYSLKEKQDFVHKQFQVEEAGESFKQNYAAALMTDKWMSPSVTYTGVIQQCLHASLQRELKLPLTISPVKSIYATMNVKGLMDLIIACGAKIIIMSATPGSPEERAEVATLYQLTFVELPMLVLPRLKEIPPLFCPNEVEQFANVTKACAHYTAKTRPPHKRHALLLPVDNIEMAERLKQALTTNHEYKIESDQILLVHADNSSLTDEEITALEKKSAAPGKISIVTTGIIERGFDPQPGINESHQIIVGDLSIISPSQYEQKKGRASRLMPNGKRRKGKLIEIYNLELECQRYPELQITSQLAYEHPEQFKHLLYHAHYARESDYRIMHQLENEVVKHCQDHFFKLWRLMHESARKKKLTDKDTFKKIRDDLIKEWSEFSSEVMQLFPSVRLASITISEEQLNDFTSKSVRKFSHFISSIYQKYLKVLPKQKSIDDLESKIHDYQINIMYARIAGRNVGAIDVPFKVYDKWHANLGSSPAFLNPGNKPWWLRIKDPIIYRFTQKKEYRDQLEKNIEEARVKYIVNANAAFRIMPRIQAVKLAKTKHNSVKTRSLIQEKRDHYKVGLTTTTIILSDDTQITFHYDPFDQGFNLTIVSADITRFSKVEAILQQVLKEAGLKKLPLNVINQSDGEICLRLNFSKVLHLDLSKLFSNLAGLLCEDNRLKRRLKMTMQWAAEQPVPKEQSMLNVLQDLKKLLIENPKWIESNRVCKNMMAYLNFTYWDIPRDEIFYFIFLPLVNLARHHQEWDLSSITQAFANYDKGEFLTSEFAMPLSFSNLKQLLRNQLKRSPNANLLAQVNNLPDTVNSKKTDEALVLLCTNLKNDHNNMRFTAEMSWKYNLTPLTAEIVLKSLKIIAHQGLPSCTADQLLIAKKQRAVALIKSALGNMNDSKDALKFVELVNSKHDDEFNPYAYIRQETGAMRFDYGNTETWENIFGLIKSKLSTLDKSTLNPSEMADYRKIMNTHRKHTYGFGEFFKPDRYCEVEEIRATNFEELHM